MLAVNRKNGSKIHVIEINIVSNSMAEQGENTGELKMRVSLAMLSKINVGKMATWGSTTISMIIMKLSSPHHDVYEN